MNACLTGIKLDVSLSFSGNRSTEPGAGGFGVPIEQQHQSSQTISVQPAVHCAGGSLLL